MMFSGIVMACRPEDLAGTVDRVEALPWARVHYTERDGRLVVTIEADDADQSIARLKELQGMPRILTAELAQYCVETH
jgi:periplasmic nitrate reductase NapD